MQVIYVHAYHYSLGSTFTELQSADVTVKKNSTLQSKEDKNRPEHEGLIPEHVILLQNACNALCNNFILQYVSIVIAYLLYLLVR